MIFLDEQDVAECFRLLFTHVPHDHPDNDKSNELLRKLNKLYNFTKTQKEGSILETLSETLRKELSLIKKEFLVNRDAMLQSREQDTRLKKQVSIVTRLLDLALELDNLEGAQGEAEICTVFPLKEVDDD